VNPGNYTPEQVRLYIAAAIRSDLAKRRAFVVDARAVAAEPKLGDYLRTLRPRADAMDQSEE
jgi:hypothetical protein